LVIVVIRPRRGDAASFEQQDPEPAPGALSPDTAAASGDSAALLENSDLLARAVRNSPFGIVLSDLEDGTILDVNEGFSRLTGYSREEAIGASAVALGLWVDPAHRAEVVATVREQRRIHDLEALIRTKAGDTRHFVASLETVVFDGRERAIYQFADLTSQRRAEAARSAAEAQFQALVEQIPAVVYTESLGDTGTYTYISPQAETIFGFSPAEILAQPGASLERIHPEDRDRVQREGERTSATGEPFRLEYRMQARDGRWVHVRDEAVLIHDASGAPLHWQGILLDITEQRQAESALRQSEERFQALFQHSSDVTTVLDADGRRVYVSPSIESLLGYAPAELLGGSALDLLHPDDAFRFQEAIADCVRGAPQTPPLELRYRHRNGEWRYFETVGTNLLHNPAVGGIVLNSRCITARKEIESALLQSEARFRSIVEGASTGMALVDRAGTILMANPALATMLGYSREELTGMTTAAISHPEDHSKQQALRHRLWTGEIERYQLEKRYLRKDGAIMWGLLSTTPIPDERGAITTALGQILDISARKATEEALRDSETRFHSAFDNAPIGLALIAPDGSFQQVNRSLCDLVGFSEGELLGKTDKEITHPDDLADDLAQVARLWAGEIDAYGMEKRYIHKDGHAVWIQLSVSAVQDDRGLHYAIAQIEDISARRHLDLERATMLASEREYTRQLRELTEMRADLTAMVGHELRSPVAALRLMTDMLATGELTPAAQAQTLETMRGQIDQMDRLASDVAASAAADRDDFAVQLQPVSLAVLLDGAAIFARTALADHDFSMVGRPDVQVWCDPERISQVLANLLGNAGMHNPPGTPVSLTVRRHGNHVRFEVTNLGPPIPPQEQALIFEKFGRGRAAAANQTSGTGLGLYLSRRIVEAHGGELWVESTPETGTTFGFDVRVAG
jgi:PAS domain S-box-containing protein